MWFSTPLSIEDNRVDTDISIRDSAVQITPKRVVQKPKTLSSGLIVVSSAIFEKTEKNFLGHHPVHALYTVFQKLCECFFLL